MKAASRQRRARLTWIVAMRATAAALATAVLIGCGPTTSPREADLGGAQPGSAAQASAPTSPTGRPVPTSTPTLELPTIRPSTPPPTTPPPPPLAVRFTSVKSPVSRGGTASVSIATTAGASCSIVVTYKSGPSTAAGLTPRSADGQGAASWSWTVGANTTTGDWPIDVTCNGARAHATFTVQ